MEKFLYAYKVGKCHNVISSVTIVSYRFDNNRSNKGKFNVVE